MKYYCSFIETVMYFLYSAAVICTNVMIKSIHHLKILILNVNMGVTLNMFKYSCELLSFEFTKWN